MESCNSLIRFSFPYGLLSEMVYVGGLYTIGRSLLLIVRPSCSLPFIRYSGIAFHYQNTLNKT